MHISHKNYIAFNQNISAFGLIEVMISAMVLSISLLGIASIQSRALNIMIEASRQETAYRMIGQLSNFALTANPSPVVGTVSPVADMVIKAPMINSACYSAPSANCTQTSSTQPSFYQNMVAEWNYTISQILPNGRGCNCVVAVGATNPQIITLRTAVKWTTLSGTNSSICFDNQILSATMGPASSYNICPSGSSPCSTSSVSRVNTDPTIVCNFPP